MNKLTKEFYLNSDVVQISKQLLGKTLFTRFNDNLTCGIIVETEAYAGVTDRASHAYNNRRTARTEVMYHEGGVAYVYLCYGMHHLFNVITNMKDVPHAVLIRAIQPTHGIDLMLQRRKKNKIDFTLTSGPGSLSKALGITTTNNGTNLCGNKIWIEENINLKSKDVIASPRVGVSYAGKDAVLPWRFYIKNNTWVSKTK